MKLEIQSVMQSLSISFSVKKLYEREMRLFKENFSVFSDFKPEDSEETIKGYIKKFLDNTFYDKKFLIKENVNNIDLVIYSGKNSDENIGVIIETKAVKNTLEMISKDDINKKAFQELVQYYLEERIINSNNEIKYLIITNLVEWFVFNSYEFEKHFYENKTFKKQYNDWYSGKLVSKNKDFFYSEIAKPFIEQSEDSIVCTYFQLCQSSETLTKLSENELMHLYKVLSHEHLLKLPLTNDSNTLNREFYNELLHIIGLHEINDKIERLPAKKRNEGSLIENTINVLIEDDIPEKILHTVSNENFSDTDNEEKIFSIGLDLSITWLNRIIFLKLLESQLIKFNNDKSFAFLNIRKIQNFDDLKELFFEALAIPIDERKEKINKKYPYIPYLNSSLFEQSQIEKDAIRINQLTHNAELPVFNATVLKNEDGKKISGEKNTLEYIFEFLDSYNFSSDSKLEMLQDNKTIINSSVLGLIFEKINGYRDGSFFTPGTITMYMCRETIRKAVIEKFKNSGVKEFKNIANLVDLHNNIDNENRKKAIEIFNKIKICDPSVGSGHFLVSALNELVAIKSELKLITDKNGKLLKNLDIEVVNDELSLILDSEPFVYNFRNTESRNIQETLFHQKQTLIEDCLFGVDINPKSVNICRLRLWIELLKNAYYIVDKNLPDFKNPADLELQTLPNIDINIKCGNSLISFFDNNGNGNGKNNGNAQTLKTSTLRYKQIVNEYKNITDKKTKQEIVRFIAEQKEIFKRVVNPADTDYQELQKKKSEKDQRFIAFSRDELTQWEMKMKRLEKEIEVLEKKYEEKRRTLYYNAFEWRYEFPEVLDDDGKFEGFDVVIGNPPYFSLQFSKFNYKPVKKFYTTYEQTGDISSLFIEKAIQILKPNGNLSFIITNRFCNTEYGKPIRNFLGGFKIYTLVNINEAEVFEMANVGTLIFDLKKIKANPEDEINLYKIKKSDEFGEKTVKPLNLLCTAKQKFFNEKHWIFDNSNVLEIKEKMDEIGKPFCQIEDLKTYRGITTGLNEIFIIDEKTKNDLIEKDKKSEKIIKPLLRGANIRKFYIRHSADYIIFTRRGIDIKKYPAIEKYLSKFKDQLEPGKGRKKGNYKWFEIQDNTAYFEEFEKEKIVWGQISSKNHFAISTNNEYSLNSTFIATGKNLKYYCAVLNSRAFLFYVKLGAVIWGKDGIKWLGDYFFNSPIPLISESKQKPIIKIVDKILKLKKENPDADTSDLEKKIDKEVYKLYNLSDAEIELIEK